MRLIDVVAKENDLECGTFGNIMEDLGAIQNFSDLNPMILMAYGYARRTVAAGLFYQGLYSLSDFQYVCQIFKSLQKVTGHTVKFQETAAAQAIELLSSYDFRLNKLFVDTITTMAVKYDQDRQNFPIMPYEFVIQTVQKIISGESTKDQINETSNSNYEGRCINFYNLIGRTDLETENNIFNAILPLIRNNHEYVQFIFEELDAASNGNSYSMNFAYNCGIDSRYFRGALRSESSIDRAGGPQQMLTEAIYTIYGSPSVSVPHRINVVKKFIAKGMEEGILNNYKTIDFFDFLEF